MGRNRGAVARVGGASIVVGATGGSDSHYLATAESLMGSPTTWVFVTEKSERGVLDGLKAGRTSLSSLPPAAGGARVFLEADTDGDGTYESMVGDTVPGAPRCGRGLKAPRGLTCGS